MTVSYFNDPWIYSPHLDHISQLLTYMPSFLWEIYIIGNLHYAQIDISSQHFVPSFCPNLLYCCSFYMSRIDNLVLTDQTRNLAFNSNSFSTLKSITFQIYTRLWALASAACCPGIQSPSSGWYSWNIVLTGLSASALTVSPFPKQQSECCVKIEAKACSCSMQTRGMIYVLIQSNPLEQSLPDMDLHCLFHHFLPWTSRRFLSQQFPVHEILILRDQSRWLLHPFAY